MTDSIGSGLPTPSLREAARRVLEGFDQGIFVRDTGGDSAPGWSLKLLPYVAALAELRAALGEPPPVDELRRFAEGDTRPVPQTYMTASGGAPPQGSAPTVTHAKPCAQCGGTEWVCADCSVRPQGSEARLRGMTLRFTTQEQYDAAVEGLRQLEAQKKWGPQGEAPPSPAQLAEVLSIAVAAWKSGEPFHEPGVCEGCDTVRLRLEQLRGLRGGEAPPSDIYERVNRHQVANEGLHELPVSMDTHLILARIRDALHEAYHLGQANDGDAFAKLDGASHRALLQAISGLRGGEAPQ